MDELFGEPPASMAFVLLLLPLLILPVEFAVLCSSLSRNDPIFAPILLKEVENLDQFADIFSPKAEGEAVEEFELVNEEIFVGEVSESAEFPFSSLPGSTVVCT